MYYLEKRQAHAIIFHNLRTANNICCRLETFCKKLRTSAQNNTVEDFEFSYFDDIDDVLIEGLEQNLTSFRSFSEAMKSNGRYSVSPLTIYKNLRDIKGWLYV